MSDDETPVLTVEPAHTDACPPDCSQRFWQAVDSTATGVIVVVSPDGVLLGTFSRYERAHTHALRHGRPGKPCTLIPQIIDTPEWGNAPLH